jgi:microcystin degradation protein MlrC
MRLFTASLSTETNTFVPIPTRAEDFTVDGGGPPMGSGSVHPCYDVLRRRSAQEGFELVEGLGASAPPSGTVRRDTYEGFRDEILAAAAAAMPLDGVVLGLHGAMVAHGYDDVEGDLLSAIRELVGPAAVIGVEFDPHMHLTQLRFDSADILICFKEFPHVDVIERAEEVCDLTLRTIRGEIAPAMAKWDARMIEVLPTGTQPMRGFVDRLMAMESLSFGSSLSELPAERLQGSSLAGERGGAMLSISCVHGFMAADVEEVGAAMVVITDGDQNKAAAMAEQLGRELFEMRGETRPQYWAPDEGVVEALRHGRQGQPAVIADVWDNPGGGPAGDGTVILRSLITHAAAQQRQRVGFAGVWDPQACALCAAAGVGASLQLRFGGKTSHMAGDPIDALVTVEGVVDDCRSARTQA